MFHPAPTHLPLSSDILKLYVYFKFFSKVIFTPLRLQVVRSSRLAQKGSYHIQYNYWLTTIRFDGAHTKSKLNQKNSRAQQTQSGHTNEDHCDKPFAITILLATNQLRYLIGYAYVTA